MAWPPTWCKPWPSLLEWLRPLTEEARLPLVRVRQNVRRQLSSKLGQCLEAQRGTWLGSTRPGHSKRMPPPQAPSPPPPSCGICLGTKGWLTHWSGNDGRPGRRQSLENAKGPSPSLSMHHTRVAIGDGATTAFWWDSWADGSPLAKNYPCLLRHCTHHGVSVREVCN